MTPLPRILALLLLMSTLPPASARSAPRPLPGRERPAFIQTTAAGDWLAPQPRPHLGPGLGTEAVHFDVDTQAAGHPIVGIGSALTEASAYVLAGLPRAQRDAVLDACFGPRGLDLTMARTHIGACDFTVQGRYSYADTPGDTALEHFSIAPDTDGFPGALDPHYDLLPLLRDALTRQRGLAIVASPWTAPAWMKDNADYYTKGKRGGQLLPEHHDTFARYVACYVTAYAKAGVPIWAVTPLNEPGGVGGQWESMEFPPDAMRDYIRDHLGPALAASGTRILQFDHNRDAVAVDYTQAALGDPACARYVWGTAVHWYSTTISACPDVLDRLQAVAPDKPLVHTEGCIDGIGNADNSPGGTFLGWRNDAWWWQPRATDWGFYWASEAEKPQHPRYAPVHRYARDIIDGLSHGIVGWIDWNLVLDDHGGPNHEHNLCGAPIMIEPRTHEVYETPVYAVLAHVSRYVRPGDHVLRATLTAPGLAPDDLHLVAVRSSRDHAVTVVALNTRATPVAYDVRIGGRHAKLTIPANALQTMRFEMH